MSVFGLAPMYTQFLGCSPNLSATRVNGLLLGFTLGVSSPATTIASRNFRNGCWRILFIFIPGVPSESETIPSLNPALFNRQIVDIVSEKSGLAPAYAFQ